MKKGWKIIIATMAVAVITIVVVAVAGKADKRVEALRGMQHFFEVSTESQMNQYLDYCRFEDMFYEKDMQLSGELYSDIAKFTVKAEVEGTIDKSNRMVKMAGNAGLGGMPFVEMELYSDDTNVYLASELFQDKLLKLNYTENLYEVGSNYGINRRNMIILQKGYIELFRMAVSQSKYEKLEELLNKKQLSKDLVQIYDHMKVEKQDNTDTQAGGYIYQVNFRAEDIKLFLQDLAAEYPEFESNGYSDIVNKFVSEEKGVEITEIVDGNGFTSELSVENVENGYELVLKRNEQEKEDNSGFESSFSTTVTKDGNGILNGEIVLDYSDADKAFQLTAREDITGISAIVSGLITTDKKEGKISIDTGKVQMEFRNANIEMYGNTEIVFGDYTVELPEGKQVDVLHGEAKELQEVKAEILHHLKGMVGSAFRQFLGSIGLNF